MSTKLASAINCGPQKVLQEFVNIDPNNPGPGLRRFVKRFGPLFPGLDGIGRKQAVGLPKEHELPSQGARQDTGMATYRGPAGHEKYLHLFRGAWIAKTDQDRMTVAEYLEDILNRRRIANLAPPRLSVDHRSLRVSIVPDTLLDLLVKWVIELPAWQLGTCELQDCSHRYYIKKHPRDRYCSPQCTREADRLKKLRWSRRSRGTAGPVSTSETPQADYRGLDDLEGEFAPGASERKLLRLVPQARKVRWPVRHRNKSKSKKEK